MGEMLTDFLTAAIASSQMQPTFCEGGFDDPHIPEDKQYSHKSLPFVYPWHLVTKPTISPAFPHEQEHNPHHPLPNQICQYTLILLLIATSVRLIHYRVHPRLPIRLESSQHGCPVNLVRPRGNTFHLPSQKVGKITGILERLRCPLSRVRWHGYNQSWLST